MADSLPIDAPGTLTRAERTRPIVRWYQPSPQELARQAAAREHLAQVAAERHESPAEFERHCLDVEWHHQIDDPAVPYSPYLSLGGQS
ncbi:hypothetical protein ACFWIB_14400 [Streptomyces sp. NPDC127051]|uniref:hypothetical protein n=1 Tax=Streptomyces sp. NPDC127051 TaxID=3347119 RepID=UPI0036682274